MTEKSIYDLGLHETLDIDKNTQVRRVPGGWIYSNYKAIRKEGKYSTSTAPDFTTLWRELVSSQFVPYSEEFLPEKETSQLDDDMIPFCLGNDSDPHFFEMYKDGIERCSKCSYPK